MAVELKVPAVGESISEVQLGDWLKAEGDFIEKDQPVLEIESDKATVELSAPQSGKISRILKRKGETAAVGEVVGYLDEAASGATAKPPPSTPAARADGDRQGNGAPEQQETRVMPAAGRALAEHGLTAQEVKATGPGGRLLKEDVERHVEVRPSSQPAARAPSPSAGGVAPAVHGMPVLSSSAAGPASLDDEVVPMSPLRRRVAQRLVEAQQTAALLTTFNEIDMSAVMELRARYREPFQEKHGVKLGFMSFFVKAAIEALKATPQINAEIRGGDIVYHNYYDIGIAVGGGKGLVVPVVRGADRQSFAELELTIADLGQRARDNKITIDELSGGTFTISKGGVYGSLLSTPIVNPPQSGILGLHAIQDRPVARAGQVVIRPMMYVALTYDHRIVDGREAVLFLRHVKEVMEDPSRMLLEI